MSVTRCARCIAWKKLKERICHKSSPYRLSVAFIVAVMENAPDAALGKVRRSGNAPNKRKVLECTRWLFLCNGKVS